MPCPQLVVSERTWFSLMDLASKHFRQRKEGGREGGREGREGREGGKGGREGREGRKGGGEGGREGGGKREQV